MDSQRKAHARTLTRRDVTFRCEWCGEEHTQRRYPGPPPRYCSDACKKDAQNTLAAARMRRHRAQQGSTPRRR